MTGALNELRIRFGRPLPGRGLPANRERGRVGRLMLQNGIQIFRSAVKRTTDSDHAFNIAPDLLQQDFAASGPNQKWLFGDASTACRPTARRHHLRHCHAGAIHTRPAA